MFLKSIQHLSLGSDVSDDTSSDKNIVIAWLKHFLFQNSLHNIFNAYKEHTFVPG